MMSHCLICGKKKKADTDQLNLNFVVLDLFIRPIRVYVAVFQ